LKGELAAASLAVQKLFTAEFAEDAESGSYLIDACDRSRRRPNGRRRGIGRAAKLEALQNTAKCFEFRRSPDATRA